MLIEKLAGGVLQVDTPIGPRFIQLNLTQRAYLIWMFRHFPSLPQQVLSERQQQLVARLSEQNGFVSLHGVGTSEAPIIGRIERRVAQAELITMRKPVVAAKSPV